MTIQLELRNWKAWEYKQAGRVFIIDPTLGNDNNLLNAVFEVLLPNGEETAKRLPEESHMEHKSRLCEKKRLIADKMIAAIGHNGA